MFNCRLQWRWAWRVVAASVVSAIACDIGVLAEAWRPRAPIVVTQLPLRSDADEGGAREGGVLRADYGDGARLLLLPTDGAPRVLSRQFHSACDPDVSFDGRRILFAGKRFASDDWSIFEMPGDGGEARQITRDVGDARSPSYQSTLYTIVSPEPWYQLTFVGSPRGAVAEHGSPMGSLYSCRLDGSQVRRLTYNVYSDMDPWLMDDGRILLASWQRPHLARGARGRVALFGVNTDGTDYALLASTAGRRIKHMPCVTQGAKTAVDDVVGRKIVFVETDESPWDGAGALASVSLRRPLHSYEPITEPSDGFYHSPSPLPDGALLVSRRPMSGGGSHGIYRFDLESRATQRVFDHPSYHDIQARLVAPRRLPDGRSSVVTESDPNGKLYCLDIGIHDLEKREWLDGSVAKALRIVEGRPWSGDEAMANDGVRSLAPRRVLGEVPIAADGSFHVEVPANVPIELQLLDARGMSLRKCSWIWAKNHEPRGCIGCHEDGELTPTNRLADAIANSARSVVVPPDARWTVTFERDIMPIIRQSCLPCHGEQGAAPPLNDAPERVYARLLERNGPDDGSYENYRYVHPGQARTSPLVWHLLGQNVAKPWDAAWRGVAVAPLLDDEGDSLSNEEVEKVIQWIDLGARR